MNGILSWGLILPAQIIHRRPKKKKKDPLIHLSGKGDRGMFERSPNATFVSLINRKIRGCILAIHVGEMRFGGKIKKPGFHIIFPQFDSRFQSMEQQLAFLKAQEVYDREIISLHFYLFVMEALSRLISKAMERGFLTDSQWYLEW